MFEKRVTRIIIACGKKIFVHSARDLIELSIQSKNLSMAGCNELIINSVIRNKLFLIFLSNMMIPPAIIAIGNCSNDLVDKDSRQKT